METETERHSRKKVEFWMAKAQELMLELRQQTAEAMKTRRDDLTRHESTLDSITQASDRQRDLFQERLEELEEEIRELKRHSKKNNVEAELAECKNMLIEKEEFIWKGTVMYNDLMDRYNALLEEHKMLNRKYQDLKTHTK